MRLFKRTERAIRLEELEIMLFHFNNEHKYHENKPEECVAGRIKWLRDGGVI